MVLDSAKLSIISKYAKMFCSKNCYCVHIEHESLLIFKCYFVLIFQVDHQPCMIFYVKVVRGHDITKGWVGDMSKYFYHTSAVIKKKFLCILDEKCRKYVFCKYNLYLKYGKA